jgi:hypothetical protein
MIKEATVMSTRQIILIPQKQKQWWIRNPKSSAYNCWQNAVHQALKTSALLGACPTMVSTRPIFNIPDPCWSVRHLSNRELQHTTFHGTDACTQTHLAYYDSYVVGMYPQIRLLDRLMIIYDHESVKQSNPWIHYTTTVAPTTAT